jgi:hypothetical protein
MSIRRAILITVLGLVFCSRAALSQCSANTDLVNNFIANEIASGDVTVTNGVATVTYGAVNSDTEATGSEPSSSMTDAFNAWNAYTSTTGVKFVQAAAGTVPDIDISQVPTTDNDCIAANDASGSIVYDSNWLGRTNTAQSTVSVEHEIGHLLGLTDQPATTNPPSVMDKATGTCSTGTSNATGISAADASNAKSCFTQAQTICKTCHK